MEQRSGVLAACGGLFATFLAVQVGALALVRPFEAAGYQTVPDPQNPANSALYLGVVLVSTAVILVALRYGGQKLLRAFLLLTGAAITVYVFGVLPGVSVGGVNVVPWIAAAVLVGALVAYPEWWVIDLAGVVMGIGAAALFGISFGVLPAVVFLGALAVYDAISVYGTRHMLTLASGVIELRVPVLLIYPTVRGFSFRERVGEMAARAEAGGSGGDDDLVGNEEMATDSVGDEEVPADEAADDDRTAVERATENGETEVVQREDEGRDSIMIGLGDAVMPTVMVASAAFFVPGFAPSVPRVAGVVLPAVTALVGTMVGLSVLLWMVLKGRAHAGLPLLNGGAILGYLVGALASGVSLTVALGLGPYL